MPDLYAITALGKRTAYRAEIGPYALAEMTELALASVVLPPDTQAKPLGLELPGPGGLTWGAGDGLAFWASPGQWMVGRQDAAGGDFAAMVAAAVPEARVTEQTDAWVAFKISANAAEAIENVLERLVNLPRPARGVGTATRTLMHHMSAFCVMRSETEVVFLGMRSQAQSLLHALEAVLHQRRVSR
ncbi:MAG: sarcosine oxidase subunit gamma [Pseudomonadota bacterium]